MKNHEAPRIGADGRPRLYIFTFQGGASLSFLPNGTRHRASSAGAAVDKGLKELAERKQGRDGCVVIISHEDFIDG